MRLEDDFAAYLTARWAVLVRMLVLLGGRRDEAEDAVRSGLARDFPHWARISGGDDPDVCVYRSVLEAWHHRPGGWWHAPELDPDGEHAPELTALGHQLDRLTGPERLVLVLRFGTGLGEQQVADVLDTPAAAVSDLVDRALARVELAAVRDVCR
jgi:DNA-directed RNA polymerase specialized sigma24 family protein